MESCIYVGLLSEICEGEQIPVIRGNRIMNPDEFADPVIVNDTTIGPTYPTRLLGFGTTISIGSSLTIDALMEGQFGHFLPNYTGYQNARRGSWHQCFATQLKMIEGYRAGNTSSALGDVTASERARCAFTSLATRTARLLRGNSSACAASCARRWRTVHWVSARP